ncbi:IEC3 subunit of the Ino80 complex, chromatin re-modelling-domain-containing protein [Xylariomycetidae sp. FL2044]|nr:IEC3 subunit of the Ino80 complex, chromatin re-modelling-domain-containing protein [Xylariomycetidae sp. FL2044]
MDRVQDDLQMTDARPPYKSWKKKYRKMRLKFDQRMQESEDLHKLEQKAMDTAKRLAVENDRLMDLLMDINESPQIPFERRIDLNLEALDDSDNDETDNSDATQQPSKSLRRLIRTVPHRSFSATIERFPEVAEDLSPKDPRLHPTSFLTADDIDGYLTKLDQSLNIQLKAPAIPKEQAADPAANFALRNPISVYNWLRRNAPKTFLQDLEKDKEKDRDDGHVDKTEDAPRKRKSGAARPTKRQSAASRKEKEKEAAEAADWDDEMAYEMPAANASKNKRKRDEDPGYRPKGGSSRPSKKRKSKDNAGTGGKTTSKSKK